MTGVLNDVPVAMGAPPLALVYQFAVDAPETVAPSVTEPMPHREPSIAEINCGLLKAIVATLVVTAFALHDTIAW